MKSEDSEVIEYLKRLDKSLENINRGLFCLFSIVVIIMFLLLFIFLKG